MKERPIIFSTQLIPKILDGTKTMTRRRINPQPDTNWHVRKYVTTMGNRCDALANGYDGTAKQRKCPHGQVGDRLWVKETYSTYPLHYKAAGYELQQGEGHWHSPIFMRRILSRITLEIVQVRVERVQEITYEDVLAEGVWMSSYPGWIDYSIPFASLWNSLNPKHPWESNDWVWVIEFRLLGK